MKKKPTPQPITTPPHSTIIKYNLASNTDTRCHASAKLLSLIAHAFRCRWWTVLVHTPPLHYRYLIVWHSLLSFKVVLAEHTFSCSTFFEALLDTSTYLEYVYIIYKTYQAKFPPSENWTIPLVGKGKTWRNARHLISFPKRDLTLAFNYKATQIFNTPSIPSPAKRSQLQPKHLPSEHKTKTNTRILQQFC